jgi:2,4-dienoyl-CoA reductase-like NADH-dependent reductase (Old Yellow Enzyme family)
MIAPQSAASREQQQRIHRSFHEEATLSTALDSRPLLFTPFTLRGVTSRNRVVVSPMSQYLVTDGTPGDWHLVHLGKFALGGAGIIFCEETAVTETSRKTYHCPGIYTDAQVRAWRRVTDFLKANGAVPAMQLGHAGRKVATKAPWEGFEPLGEEDAPAGQPPWRGYSSSAVPFKPGSLPPIEMDRDDIRQVIGLHVEAVKRTLDAGFDICEIHAAHGYLIQQFLSPIVNGRTDAYGGDIEGRMRFGLELIEAVREAWPADKPLLVRVSCVDGSGGGWSIEDTVVFAAELKQRGVDLIDCSSGGINGPLTLSVVPRDPGYHIPFAECVRRDVGIPTMGPGLITTAEQAESYLAEGRCDLIAIAREMIWDPYWPVHAARTLGCDDYLDMLPPTYAWWLKRREEASRATVQASS